MGSPALITGRELAGKEDEVGKLHLLERFEKILLGGALFPYDYDQESLLAQGGSDGPRVGTLDLVLEDLALPAACLVGEGRHYAQVSAYPQAPTPRRCSPPGA